MLNSNYYCVIMAGGVGARFWPMSNTAIPKQFMDILGDGQTLIQKTFERFSRVCPKENIYIITNKTYHKLTREQFPDISEEQIILEPYRRNTAPCIAYANFKIREKNPNAVVVVAPSDHYIEKEDVFVDVIQKGLDIADQNPSDIPEHRLRLHPVQRGRGFQWEFLRFCGENLHRETGIGNGEELFGERRLLMECRHLHVVTTHHRQGFRDLSA